MSGADNTVECGRRLIHVPILHSPVDMGTMGEGLEAAYIERFGRRHWDEYLALLEGFWPAVRAGLEQLGLDYTRVDLYQDGLPVCGSELEIVKKAAAMGGQNHQLLLDLAARGATLRGTEDPRLLLTEYHGVQAALSDGPGKARSREDGGHASRYAEVLSKRDAYIGQRIGQSLQPGRTGILFLGMMHKVESFLPTDIVVARLVPAIPARKDKAPQ